MKTSIVILSVSNLVLALLLIFSAKDEIPLEIDLEEIEVGERYFYGVEILRVIDGILWR